MDLEGNEGNNKRPEAITQYGSAWIDTRDSRGLAPGVGAGNWLACTRYYHIRVYEHRNSDAKFNDANPVNLEFKGKTSQFIKHASKGQVMP